jgi:stress-induced morphogen
MLPTIDVATAMKAAIEAAVPEAIVEIDGIGGGHFTVRVTSPAFAGQGTLARQRMVLAALRPFLSGPDAPVHAIDHLQTETP